MNINRIKEVPMEGLMCDLLWSDPKDVFSIRDNTRGVGHVFGKDCIDRFLAENNLESVIRSHQLVMEGYM
jgi:diadenosine tetraphosphatase ApaH/serine/threonine PP2A family protein phosphatase